MMLHATYFTSEPSFSHLHIIWPTNDKDQCWLIRQIHRCECNDLIPQGSLDDLSIWHELHRLLDSRAANVALGMNVNQISRHSTFPENPAGEKKHFWVCCSKPFCDQLMSGVSERGCGDQCRVNVHFLLFTVFVVIRKYWRNAALQRMCFFIHLHSIQPVRFSWTKMQLKKDVTRNKVVMQHIAADQSYFRVPIPSRRKFVWCL